MGWIRCETCGHYQCPTATPELRGEKTHCGERLDRLALECQCQPGPLTVDDVLAAHEALRDYQGDALGLFTGE